VEKHGRVREATDDSIIQCMRIACFITKTQDTHSEYVIPVPFPRQQWLRERVSVLRHTYIVFSLNYKVRFLDMAITTRFVVPGTSSW
jgi:hypothetical protein